MWTSFVKIADKEITLSKQQQTQTSKNNKLICSKIEQNNKWFSDC